MFKTVLISAFVLIGIVFIGAFFVTPEFSGSCADGVIDCLTEVSHQSFFGKIGGAFRCVFNNVLCVLHQVISVF